MILNIDQQVFYSKQPIETTKLSYKSTLIKDFKANN